MTRVLLVCTGNICRSPIAEAMIKKAIQGRGVEIEVESAGTGAWDGVSVSEGAYLVGLETDHDLSTSRA
ncbi:MAG: low molecular weight protein arginine phosphatase, partial [Gemmatimonadetes bacterium]|nr:low molecular weight protein arginine phosphatase [Gemmatimonadota bacterium]